MNTPTSFYINTGYMLSFSKKIFFVAQFVLLISSFAFGQKRTTVRGTITDATTKETMIYVDVQFDETNIGTNTDLEGNFSLETTTKVSAIRVTYLGYKTQIVPIQYGETNELALEMTEEGISLQAVEIKVEKYRNKGNPAVELIKKVIDNKDKNRKEGFDSYSYNKHEKMEFALNNVTEKMKNNIIFRKVKFVFDNADTSAVDGRVSLPLYLQENITDVYYRQNPKSKKEYVRAERLTNIGGMFNTAGLSSMMANMYQEIDFYDNTIMLLTNGFVSPLAPLAPNIYRFYIQDTTVINGESMIHMYFAPRTKSDFAFMGDLWIANDSTYALRKIETSVPNDINLNWVKGLGISQEFDWVDAKSETNFGEKRGLMLTKDELFVDFALNEGKDSKSVLGTKTTSYKDILINPRLSDTIFAKAPSIIKAPDALEKSDMYWQIQRHEPLTKSEAGIYQTVDSLNNFKPFTRAVKIVRLIFEGYSRFGGFDLGPTNTFYSFNPVEGFRMRVGGRTNFKLSKQFMLEGYGAYGTLDKKFKGYGSLRVNFGKDRLLRFPYNQLKLWYIDDIKIPGQDLDFVQEDNIFLSFKRGVNDKMIYTATTGIEYLREFQHGFSYSVTIKNTRQRPAGQLFFDYDTLDERRLKGEVMTSEAGLMLRYAPNEKFYEGATYRTPMLTKFPIFEFHYAAGLKGQGYGEYNYHKLNLKIRKGFFLPPFGYSTLIVEGGRIFGQAPYILLTQHRANQTYAYQKESYNLMNFLEFVSDKFVSINYDHNFQGVFFGRIPLLNKLKWREVATIKALWGGLDQQNIPSGENELLRFPVDVNGQPLTQSLGSKPYLEASVGIANIFKLIRLDYIRRINYTDLPNVSKWGIRARVKFEF